MRHTSTPPVQRIVGYPIRATLCGDLCTSCGEDVSVHAYDFGEERSHCLSCRCGGCE